VRLWSANAVVAEELRCRAQETDPPFSVERLLDEASPGAVVAGHDLPEGIDEVVAVTPDGAVILHRCGLVAYALRFAVAHAIAHILLDVDEGHLRPGPLVDDERESRADALALELLAPDRLLQPKIVFWPSGSEDIYAEQLERISVHFGVPLAAIDQRIRQLEQSANL
jgi:hypothetical protein